MLFMRRCIVVYAEASECQPDCVCESEFDMTSIEFVQQCPLHADPLTAGELDEAIHAFKCGKAGGENSLVSER